MASSTATLTEKAAEQLAKVAVPGSGVVTRSEKADEADPDEASDDE